MVDAKLVIGTEIDYRKFDKQIDELDKKASVLETKISDPKKYNIDITKAEADLEKIKNKMEVLNKKSLEVGLKNVSNIEFNPDRIKKFSNGKLQMEEIGGSATKLNGQLNYVAENLKDIKVEAEEVGKKGQEANNKNSNSLSKNTKTLQRFAFRLLNVASIYSVVSKASSAYLSTNEELANKLQSVWVGLGSFLAPAINMISDALLKALGYLNVFVSELTGIDFIARANARALKSQASAQKELNNQSYDFDVVRKQQDTSTNTSGGGFSGGSGLIEIPELDENLVRKLQEMAKWLKENWYWLEQVGKVLLVTFGAVKIGQVLANIAGLINGKGATVGLLKLSSVLGGLMKVGVITIGVDLIYKGMTGKSLIEDLGNIKNGLKEVKEAEEKNLTQSKKYTVSVKELNKNFRETIYNAEMEGEKLEVATDFLRNHTETTYKHIMAIENKTSKTKKDREEEELMAVQLSESIKTYDLLYKTKNLNKEGVEEYAKALDLEIRLTKHLGQDTKKLEENFRNLTGKDWTLKLNLQDNTKSAFDTIASRISNIFSLTGNVIKQLQSGKLNSLISALSGGRFKGFALGGIVTQPTRALIGEAGYPEAVVPMTQDYLSVLASEIARFGGSGGSGGNVNVYLDGRLIQRQINNRQQQIKFNKNS